MRNNIVDSVVGSLTPIIQGTQQPSEKVNVGVSPVQEIDESERSPQQSGESAEEDPVTS